MTRTLMIMRSLWCSRKMSDKTRPTVLILLACVLQLFAGDLKVFPNCKLMDEPGNDGDSFGVRAESTSFIVRLYFVDCPETSMPLKSDAERVRAQTRYFGLTDAAQTIQFGKRAKSFVDSVLAAPFTVHTAFTSALGRSAGGRIYGFVTTGDGNDLAVMLLKNGLARAHGMGRETPDGVSLREMTSRLKDFETSAMLKRVGIWSESNPDGIAEQRAKQRSDDNELLQFQSGIKKSQSPQHRVNINTATLAELDSVPGIGSVLAKRIIEGRPYKSVDELARVDKIGPQKLEKIRGYFTVGNEYP
jgi:competence protein ComEA